MIAERLHRNTSALRAVAACAGTVVCLGGCIASTGPAGPNLVDDGVKCSDALATAPVYLEVSYDASGMPAVDPVTCEIDRGTQVTWRGPIDTPVVFEVRFKGASPSSLDPRGVLQAVESGERYRIRRELDGAPGQYDYAVYANGKELDPAIIIR